MINNELWKPIGQGPVMGQLKSKNFELLGYILRRRNDDSIAEQAL